FDSIFTSIPGINNRVEISGFSLLNGAGSFYGFGIGNLKPWEDRDKSVQQIINELQRKTAGIKEAQIQFFAPPAIPGFGASSGFTVHLLDLHAGSLKDLAKEAQKISRTLTMRPEIQYAMSTYRVDYPQYKVVVDVAKAMG